MEEEQDAQEARSEARRATAGAPFRFFTPVQETREIVIVDDAPDFFRKEHALKVKGSTRYDTFVPCIDEHTNCPACAAATDRQPAFCMYLTIIDLTGYEGKDGWVDFSKKLLVVKPTQQKKIMRLYERHKSLRGMVLSMTRDSKEDAAIGNDIEFIEFMDEETLAGYVYSYTDKEDKVHEVDCSVPFDYDEIMPEMTEQQIRAIVGGRPDPGNRAQSDRDLREGDDWDREPPPRRAASRRGGRDEDDGAPEPAPRRAARPAGRRADPDDDDGRQDNGREVEEDDPPPARGARRPARQVAPAEDPPFDQDDQQEEEAEPARPARRAAPTTRRAAEAPPERPQRDAGAVANRRASLRRS